jgi:hypothetical protein
MPSTAMLRHVALVRIDISEERRASIIMVTRIGELGATLAVTSNRCWSSYLPPKRPFLQEPHGVTSQKTAFFKWMVVCIKSVFDTMRREGIATG